jgi:hypothetical protein
MKTSTRFMKGTVAIALAALVIVPVSASAITGAGTVVPAARVRRSATASATATVDPEARRALLKERIARVLANRARAFEAAVARISSRIDRVAALAGTVEKAGGDVSGVTASLEAARSKLARARTAEAKAVAMFKAVPDSSNRRAAFRAAKAQARIARILLDGARLNVRGAILKLKVIVYGLKGAAQ